MLEATTAHGVGPRGRDRIGNLADFTARLPRPTLPVWLLVVAPVAIVTWPINTAPAASGGYDISWIAALHVAAHSGLHFGSQFNDTYGPLGYLTIGNMFYDRTGIPADFVTGALYVGVLIIVARPICRAFGIVAGGLLVFALARLAAAPFDPVELLNPLIAAIGIIALRRGELSPLQAVAISMLIAFSVLDKLSGGPVGLIVLVLLVITTAARPGAPRGERMRQVGILLGSFLAGVIVMWLLARQSLFDLPAYLRNSYETISGYADAESLSAPDLEWQYIWAAVSAVVVLAVASSQDRKLPRLRCSAIALLWLSFVAIEFRHAFVRFAPGHAGLFFAPLALLSAAVLVRRARWRAGLVACLLPLALVWQVGSWNVQTLFSVSTTSFVQQVNMLLSPNLRHRSENQAIASLRAYYAFPAALVARLTGQTVHFEPFDAAAAWAYPMIRWDPPPYFQSNDAYTSHLDDLNARFLASSAAPRYILRENVALDGRDVRFESPRYMLEMICRYREVMTIPGWQLLERGPDRCGAPVPAGSERVRFDQPVAVPVPTPDSIVVASFTDFSLPLSDTLGELLFKRPVQYIAVNGNIFRFVPGHGANPHVMSFPTCLGWSPALFDPAPYRVLALGHLPQLITSGASEWSSYRVSFQRVPFSCS